MELVIKIPEEVVKNDDYVNYFGIVSKKLVETIKNGTPLPKGHGRLIDTDDINQVIKPLEASDSTWGMTAETAKRLMYEAFNRCPTIIKADRSVEDGNDNN